MKKEQKRIKNDEFQQVEECYECKKLFWASSEFELGNWERICKKCAKKIEIKDKKLMDEAKKNGEPVLNSENKIRGWKYKNKFYFNDKYIISQKNYEIVDGNKKIVLNYSNIDDYVRQKKKQGVEEMSWSVDCWSVLNDFLIIQGFDELENGDRFMGIRHFKNF